MFRKVLFVVIMMLTGSSILLAQAFPFGDGSSRQPHNLATPLKTDSIRTGSAWTLTFPLGDHIESVIDTFSYNYQRKAIPSMQSDAYATTGNLGAEGINLIYFQRPARQTFFFNDALYNWMPTFGKTKFYNVYIPTTILQYGFAGSKLTHQDRLTADFAGNVNRRIGIGGWLDYLYSKGSYEAQATKDFNFGFTFYYTGDRYEAQAFYNHFYMLNKENGGITNDLYITDPAELQAGVNKIDSKSIPTRLTGAHSRINGDELFMTHALKLGYWKTEQVNDTLTREVYVPLTRFIYSFDLQHNRHKFLNSNTTQGNEFWANRYLDLSGTDDNTYMNMMTNSFGVELIEGFRDWAKFGLSAYISYQIQKYRQSNFYTPIDETADGGLTALPANLHVAPTDTRNMLWVGGRLQKDKGNILRYNANVRFGLIGDVIGDVELEGGITTKFKLFGDSVRISANAEFQNKAQPYLLQKYISNHFAWDNDFGKTRRYKINGQLLIPWTNTEISAGVENIQNMVYFDEFSLPAQFGGNIQVFSASLNQKLRFGILNWNNTLIYQKTSNSDILPLPDFTLYSNLFIKFIAFRVLKLQIGVDMDYYTRYKGLDYQPATMSFHVQGEDKIKVGNYPFCNLYVSARLYQTRFYILWSHINQGWFSKNSFVLPHYPLNPRRLEFGLSVDFSN